jgi:hypothetical protein
MMHSTSDSCPHERRPGITVCLHCRRAERQAIRARRRRSLGKAGMTLFSVAAIAAAGAAAVMVMQGNWPLGGVPTVAAAPVVVRAVPFVVDSLAAAALDSGAAMSDSMAAADSLSPYGSVAEAAIAPPAPPPPPPPLEAVIAQGRTQLRDGVFAVRVGDTIAVHFDTPRGRTRRSDKLEAIVRATLPAVYGAAADSLLARVPAGAMIAGDLLGEVMERGVRLALGDGWTLALWPETRAGRDGPLVVTYRATVAR